MGWLKKGSYVSFSIDIISLHNKKRGSDFNHSIQANKKKIDNPSNWILCEGCDGDKNIGTQRMFNEINKTDYAIDYRSGLINKGRS